MLLLNENVFQFNKAGPHPEVHCPRKHIYVCCICLKAENVFHEGGQAVEPKAVEAVQEIPSPKEIQEVI